MAKEAEQRKIALSYVHDFLLKSNLKQVADLLLAETLLNNVATREDLLRRPTNNLLAIVTEWRKANAAQLKDNEWFAAECKDTSYADSAFPRNWRS